MSDRLNDLRRERAVIQAHLEWLDREIAAQAAAGVDSSTLSAASAATTTPRDPSASSVGIPQPLTATAAAEASSPEIDAALDSYRQDPVALQSDIRKGCFLYFAGAFLLLFLVVGAFYLYSRSLHTDRAAPAPAIEEPLRR